MNVAQAVQTHLASLDAGHCDFEATLELIDRYFHVTPVAFSNGPLHNAPNQNHGACRVFALGQFCNLTESQTLLCFGRHYQQVLDEPASDSHANIRQFMTTGWSGITFSEAPLRPRPFDEIADQQENSES